MGGFSAERHISVESGRNIYQKLSSSAKYDPTPIFLSGSNDNNRLFIIPINLILKDNADDIHSSLISTSKQHEYIQNIRNEATYVLSEYLDGTIVEPIEIDYKFLANKFDFVFIALHGHPGEDGTMQRILDRYKIPYNGSGVEAASITMNKYKTNQLLKENGFCIAEQILLHKDKWIINKDACIASIEQKLEYPLIAKPVDDGCSAAVLKIENRQSLLSFAEIIFRTQDEVLAIHRNMFGLRPNVELPKKDQFIVEALIQKGNANKFIEITCGLLSHMNDSSGIVYEIFNPSEVLVSDGILSLEEKFLSGEGKNITPARFSSTLEINNDMIEKVKKKLELAARLLNIEGYARIDAFVKIYDKDIEVWIIEVNSLPAMTPATCIFHQCALNGYTPLGFIDNIIQYGLGKI